MPLVRLYVCVTSAVSWTTVAKKQCATNKYSNSYDTVKSAKEACLALGDQCTAVYDGYCDGAGSQSLCKPGAFGNSASSCLYTPSGSYVFMHTYSEACTRSLTFIDIKCMYACTYSYACTCVRACMAMYGDVWLCVFTVNFLVQY